MILGFEPYRRFQRFQRFQPITGNVKCTGWENFANIVIYLEKGARLLL